ncbi:LOW QUALITY PROTEIN: hypothetical protein BDA96_09G262200 [Sorghum bicolor]|uniref:Uncharacterized protein n=1 Tax=Sorghum bicolor TaxID=4558 RepID=A0A921U6C0_SORBI|nr:LOW QUALITY PROTEIN: hypothetical protein BDA96_09G262200 [Sorghum bicolor]
MTELSFLFTENSNKHTDPAISPQQNPILGYPFCAGPHHSSGVRKPSPPPFHIPQRTPRPPAASGCAPPALATTAAPGPGPEQPRPEHPSLDHLLRRAAVVRRHQVPSPVHHDVRQRARPLHVPRELPVPGPPHGALRVLERAQAVPAHPGEPRLRGHDAVPEVTDALVQQHAGAPQQRLRLRHHAAHHVAAHRRAHRVAALLPRHVPARAQRRLGLGAVQEHPHGARRVAPLLRVVVQRGEPRHVLQPRQHLHPRVRRRDPPLRQRQRHRLGLQGLQLPLLPRVHEAQEVGRVRVRRHLRHRPVADGHAAEVHALRLGKRRVRVQDVRPRRGDVLARVALAREEEGPRAEGRVEGVQGLQRGEDVCGDHGLVRGDVGRRRRRAEAGAQRAVDEEEAEAAVPREGVAPEGVAVGVDEVGAELEEVAQEAGAAWPALQPEEERRGGRRRDRVRGLVEGEEEGGVGGWDGEVPRFRRHGFLGEHHWRPRSSWEWEDHGEEDEEEWERRSHATGRASPPPVGNWMRRCGIVGLVLARR